MDPTTSNSLINIGELSKPATVLVEKISEAVGGVFKPYQLVRMAKAEVQADRLRAEAQIEISDIQRRAFHRFIEEEGKKQKNIEDITQKALPQVEENSKPTDVENDWITNFFDRCRLISDDEMQALWSRVLAGEANSPGTYSKRTVNFLSDLDKSDADLFTQLCSFGWQIGNVVPLIYDEQAEIYTKSGINLTTLNHLESIGLIKFQVLSFHRVHLPKHVGLLYYGKPTFLSLPKDEDNALPLGKVMLSKVGQELAPICGSKPAEGFLEYIRDKWRSDGYVVADEPYNPEQPTTDPPAK